MPSFAKVLRQAAIAGLLVSTTLSACTPKAVPVKPNAEQLTSLNRLYKNCIPAAAKTGTNTLKNLARHRKPELYFTCDEMKQLCEKDYGHDRCQGMMIVASIENAVHKACRTRSTSPACRKLDACNIKGFESPECLSAIKPYNR